MKKLLLLLVLCSSVQVAVAQSRQEMTSVDAVAFMRGADSVQLEVYFSILQKGMKFTQEGNQWSAPIVGSIVILQDGKPVTQVKINKTKKFSGSKEELEKHIADELSDGAIFKVAAISNTEAIVILAPTEAGGVSDTIRRRISMPIRVASTFQFSNIELATSLSKTDDKTSVFEKVGYSVMPNISNIYGDNLNKLYYYTEITSGGTGVSPSDKADLILRVVDGSGHEMYKNSQPVTFAAETIPVLGSAEIDGLPSDSYILELSLVRAGVSVAKTQRTFYYDSGIQFEEPAPEQVTTAQVDENTLFLTSDFKTMSELELEERATQSFYGAQSSIVKEYKKLPDVEAKRMYLFKYWRNIDKNTPNAVPLSAYRTMTIRVIEANKTYSYMKVPGWTTDRGRIYIQYGKPDQIDAHQFAIDSKPYIIWEYTSQRIRLSSGSRAQFVFVDKRGGGNFQLVSSNAQGEVYDPDWYSHEARRTQ